MLLFASAGLDSMVKQLARDCLSLVIERHEGAREQFRVFLERRLRDEETRFSTLSRFMVGSDPVALRQLLVDDVTAKSLQSVEQLSRAGSYFDIATSDLLPDVERLKNVFAMRNQIAHEMDVSTDSGGRRQRDFPSMSGATNEIFDVSDRFLSLVAARLPNGT